MTGLNTLHGDSYQRMRWPIDDAKKQSILEVVMTGYEIRILNKDGGVLSTVLALHVNDYAAVRSARKLAADRAVEVWRDLDCIYRDPVANLGQQPRKSSSH